MIDSPEQQAERENARFRNLQVSILKAAEARGVIKHAEIGVFLEQNALELRAHIEDLMERNLTNEEIVDAGVIYITTHRQTERLA